MSQSSTNSDPGATALGDLGAAAHAYATRGWSVLPLHRPLDSGSCSCGDPSCGHVGKHPDGELAPRGVRNAMTDPAIIDRWWAARPGANVGIDLAGAGLLVIAPDSPEWQAEFEDRGLPRTATAQSGGGDGHVHYYYRLPKGCPTHRLCKPGEYDILSNGHVVAPPSRHGSGRRYEWLVSPEQFGELPEAPAWAVDALAAAAAPPEAPPDDPDAPPVRLDPDSLEWWIGERWSDNGSGKIDRSVTLFAIGCRLAEAGAARKTIAEALAERDEALGYRKFTGRSDAAKRYDEIALQAIRMANGADPDWAFGDESEGTTGDDQGVDPNEPDGGGQPRSEAGTDKEGLGTREPHVAPDWPAPLDPAAYYGLAGEIVAALEPGTEADPVALLLTFLAAVGNIVGSGPHWTVSGRKHPLLLYPVLVGRTSKGRKGTAWGSVKAVLDCTVQAWSASCLASGLSSGEGLIWRVRDPITKRKQLTGSERGQYATVVEDEGIADKRLLVVEEEFASVLKVMAREGSTLSAVIRQAWDHGNLSTLVKQSPAKATGGHVTVFGHVTQDELLRYLNDTEAANGFANRFIWACVKRSKVLPDGGWVDQPALDRLVPRLNRVLRAGYDMTLIQRDAEASELWRRVYGPLSEGGTGLLGAITGRAEAQVMRLAAIYAVLDGSPLIRPAHLRAGVAVWDYAEESARVIFGDATGDPLADTILRALRAGGEMNLTEISNLFGRNQSAARIEQALGMLLAAGLARRETRKTGGRSATVWHAT